MKPLSLVLFAILLFAQCSSKTSRAEDQTGSTTSDTILTVTGPIPADSLGLTLIHEHVFLDWSGADSIRPQDWDEEAAFQAILPYLLEMKQYGVNSFLECTPAYLGRNPSLLHRLSVESGLQILTNTGFYGARQNRYIPAFAFDASAGELADIWVKEYEQGIEDEDIDIRIRPGFIKISVEADSQLSDMHRKLVQAAAMTHLRTGLAIVSHTGIDTTAALQLAVLEEAGVAPGAFVWTHAQNGTAEGHVRLARRGAWISLDGLGWVTPKNGDSTALYQYAGFLKNLKSNGLLQRTLISHDAGWYTHGEPGSGDYKGYTPIFTLLKPLLLKEGFTEEDFRQLLVENPKEAYAIRVRSRQEE